jgi:hypothetical protein
MECSDDTGTFRIAPDQWEGFHLSDIGQIAATVFLFL